MDQQPHNQPPTSTSSATTTPAPPAVLGTEMVPFQVDFLNINNIYQFKLKDYCHRLKNKL
jgi:hypothetical protein